MKSNGVLPATARHVQRRLLFHMGSPFLPRTTPGSSSPTLLRALPARRLLRPTVRHRRRSRLGEAAAAELEGGEGLLGERPSPGADARDLHDSDFLLGLGLLRVLPHRRRKAPRQRRGRSGSAAAAAVEAAYGMWWREEEKEGKPKREGRCLVGCWRGRRRYYREF